MAIDDIRLKLSFLPLLGNWFVRSYKQTEAGTEHDSGDTNTPIE